MPITTIFEDQTATSGSSLGSISSTTVGSGYTSQYSIGSYGELHQRPAGAWSNYLSNSSGTQSGTNGCRLKVNHTAGSTQTALSVRLQLGYGATSASGEAFHLYFHYKDISNFYRVQWQTYSSEFYTMIYDQVVGGTRTQLASLSSIDVSGYTSSGLGYAKWEYTGTAIKLYLSATTTFGSEYHSYSVSGLSGNGDLCIGAGKAEDYNNSRTKTMSSVRNILVEANISAASLPPHYVRSYYFANETQGVLCV